VGLHDRYDRYGRFLPPFLQRAKLNFRGVARLYLGTTLLHPGCGLLVENEASGVQLCNSSSWW